MQNKRKRRAAVGTICLVVVALAMGWFVGQYIPGTPKSPESLVFAGMYDGSGEPAQEIVDVEFGQTASLETVTQGDKFYWDILRQGYLSHDTGGATEEQIIENIKKGGHWEYEYPTLAIRIDGARTVSAASFAELYPDFTSRSMGLGIGDAHVEDTTLILVSASITNESDEIISGFMGVRSKGSIPTFTLWTDWTDVDAESVILDDDTVAKEAGPLCDNTLGSGIQYDMGAFTMLNDSIPLEKPDPDGATSQLIYIKPGETQSIVIPYGVPNKTIEGLGDAKHLDLSKFCIQTPDFASGTMYRLWLE